MIELSQADFTAYVDLLKDLEEWRMESERWRLINDVLTGVAMSDRIRGQINVSGAPRAAAVSLLTTFNKFGQPEPGKELIGILTNKLLDGYVFDTLSVDFLRGLFSKYELDKAVARQSPITDWKGSSDPEAVLEKIIGENTLRHVMLLELALLAVKAVVWIRTPDGLGSGFLCGENFIMTNHHIIASAETAKQSEFAFFYELDRDNKEKPTHMTVASAEGLFFTDATLDITVIQIATVPEGVAPLRLKRGRIQRDQRVSIIQHPGGRYKKISMQNNFVEYADNQVVQYTTSTEPGSSGSPVLDDDFNVIAIHHSGGNLLQPNSNRRYLRNAGSTMIAALNIIEQNAPVIYAKLNRV